MTTITLTNEVARAINEIRSAWASSTDTSGHGQYQTQLMLASLRLLEKYILRAPVGPGSIAAVRRLRKVYEAVEDWCPEHSLLCSIENAVEENRQK